MAEQSSLEAVRQRLAGAGNRVDWTDAALKVVAARYNVSVAALAPMLRSPEASPRSDLVAPVVKGGTAHQYTFTISTSSPDRMGDTIAIAGWKTDAYKRNSVVLWQHDASSLPVGRTVKLWTDGNKLKATVELATAFSRYAGTVQTLVDGGFLRAASVGFSPLKFKFSDVRKGGIDFLEQELLEWSIVTIPANAECLIDPNQTGKSLPVDPVKRRRERDLDVMRARAGILSAGYR